MKMFEYQGKDYSIYIEDGKVVFTTPSGFPFNVPLPWVVHKKSIKEMRHALHYTDKGWLDWGDISKSYKTFNNFYGITLSLLLSLTRGWWWKVVVGENPEHQRLFKKFCCTFRNGKPLIYGTSVYNWIKYKEDILQMYRDGNERLLWVAFQCEKFNTKDLKEEFGKGTWKSLCKLSDYSLKDWAAGPFLVRKSDARVVANLSPSQRLKFYHLSKIQGSDRVDVLKVAKDRKIPANKFMKDRIYLLVRDTIYMCLEMGEGIPSYDSLFYRYKETHDEVLDKFLSWKEGKETDPTPFESLSVFPSVIEHEGVVATKLDSMKLLTKEGKTMHHCVGSYGDMCRDGQYLVYHIEGEGVMTSTIGMRLHKENNSIKVRLSQHYGHCNKPVDEATSRFGVSVVYACQKAVDEFYKLKEVA